MKQVKTTKLAKRRAHVTESVDAGRPTLLTRTSEVDRLLSRIEGILRTDALQDL